MLQSLGDSLKGTTGHKWRRWGAYLLLGLLSVIFAAWGAYGIVNLNFGGSNYAAEANGAKISLEDARNAWLREQTIWQQRAGAGEMPPSVRARLQDGVLEGLIRNALLTRRSRDLGYRVSMDSLREAVRHEPAFQISGQYSPEAAKAALAQAGISLDEYEQELRSQLQRVQLEGGIRASDFMTATELKRSTDLQDEEREARYFVLPAERFKAAAPADAAVQAYYDAHRAQYMSPEVAHLKYAELRLDTLAAQQQGSDEDLRAAYAKEQSRLTVPEKRRARHILVTGKDDAAALKLAQDVLAQARAGKDFGELAKRYSQDPGSAKNGGDLGWAERGAFVKPFADALFNMKVGEIAGPVKTQFGYHIIRLDAIQPAKGKSFEEARPDLEAELRRDRATDRFGDIQEELQTKLTDPGANLTALAQAYGMQQGDVPAFAKGAGAAPLGPAPPLQDLLFGDPPLAVGSLGGPVVLGDDRLVIVQVLDHRPPEEKSLAEVRAGIVAALTRERTGEATLEAAQAARAKLESGASFDAVMQGLAVHADPAHFVGRQDPSIPAQVRAAVFSAARPLEGKPVYGAVALSDGGAALIDVSAVRTAAVQDPQEQAARTAQEIERAGDASAAAYVEEVRFTAKVRKNPKAFE